MWFQALLLAVLAVQEVASDSSSTQRKFTELDAVDYFRHNPLALPRHARIIFEEKAKQFPELRKRQSSTTVALLGALSNTISSLGRPLPYSTVSTIQDGPSKRFAQVPGARLKKIRYGPYRIPPVSEKNIEFQMLQQTGMTNTLKFGARKPCEKECMLFDVNASLEYANGTALPSSPEGAWLHHVVLMNVGLNVRDAVCGGIVEHVFQSGNERSDSPYYSPPSGVKSAYHVRNEDILVLNTELMNMEDKEKWAWVTLEYDYIEGFDPAWKEGKIVWMSVGPNRCTGSDLNPFGVTNLTRTQQPTKDVLVEYSVPWTAPADGLILGGNCHMHDGGMSAKFYLEDNLICESVPKYAKGDGHGHGGMSGMKKRQMGVFTANAQNSQIEHIVDQPPCVFTEPRFIKKGQEMYMRVDYDFTKHAGMKNKNGELDEIMGIAGALIAFDFPMK